jgi:hypothetical protein
MPTGYESTRPGAAEQLADTISDAMSDLVGPHHADVAQLVDAYASASSAFVDEHADIDKNADRLEIGAGDRRRRAAAAELAERLDVANRLADAQLDALQETLIEQALPSRPGATETKATRIAQERLDREEVAMLFANVKPGDLAAKLTQLASGPRDDLASLIFTPWGESFLASKGGVKPELIRAVKLAAANARQGAEIKRTMTAARKALLGARQLAAARTEAASRQHRRHEAGRARIGRDAA